MQRGADVRIVATHRHETTFTLWSCMFSAGRVTVSAFRQGRSKVRLRVDLFAVAVGRFICSKYYAKGTPIALVVGMRG